jgi:tRNA-2-methylthio-N6-dimethylallyladenosine synthase
LVQERYLFIETYGCQMNDSDSEKIASLLSGHNYRPTNDMEKADLIILNTCSIRNKAEQKVYSFLGTLKPYKERKPELVIGVGGCVAQQQGERLLKRVPHLDIVFGTHNIQRLPELVGEAMGKRGRFSETRFYDDLSVFLDPMPKASSKVTGLVTVMLGCNNFCSYCIVPYVRGREISRPSADIAREIEGLVASGVREVTLIGQSVNSYGDGLQEETDFPALLDKVNGIEGLKRIRFTTSHPKDLSGKLIDSFGRFDKLCEHIHLPVQSGSDRVLDRMNRRYTMDSYLLKVDALRRVSPDIAITSDMIVGFPGETEGDFDETMDLIERVRYDSLFSFKFSPRPETRAAGLPDQVPEDVKAGRLSILQERQRGISLGKNLGHEGRILEVLVEGRSETNPDRLSGRTRTNKVVNFQGGEGLIGETVMVRVTKGSVNSLMGEVV